ncbi:MAG TPA: DUF4388 domain-containing protein [Anaeromyxobacteraceae bacterium]|jgi:CheY-like chemotaxis protein|nr:DUF4388 domain-containing protein [Anaeromyxobacteraceae bacterium]
MPTPPRVLLAHPDAARARAHGAALRRLGCEVQHAQDGQRALELAVLRPPDLVVASRELPLVASGDLARILSANPRTRAVPFLALAACSAAELAAEVEGLLGRGAAAAANDLAGSLDELPLFDLLQGLAQNRRTGRLAILRPLAGGELGLSRGALVDAGCGAARGSKALHRLLAGRGGRFTFRPEPAVAGEPLGSLEALLLEAARRADEGSRLLAALGGTGAHLARGAAELRPEAGTAAELWAALSQPRPVAALLDSAGAGDLEVLESIAALLRAGALRPAASARAAGALLGTAAAQALSRRVRRRGASGPRTVGTVAVLARDPTAVAEALPSLRALPGFSPEPSAPGRLGTIGRIALAGGPRLDLVLVPCGEEDRPLWRLLGAGALGALALGVGLAAAFAAELEEPLLPVAEVAAPGPGLDPRGAGEALLALLAAAAREEAR